MYQYSANFSPQTFSETHFCAEFEKVCDQRDIFFVLAGKLTNQFLNSELIPSLMFKK